MTRWLTATWRTILIGVSMVDRKNLTWAKIALLSGLGGCVSIAALATPGIGVLFNAISRATVEAFDAESQNGKWQIHLDTNGPSDVFTQSITLLPGGSWMAQPSRPRDSVSEGWHADVLPG